MRLRLAALLIPAQAAAATVALAALTMWPPSSGKMLLVPLGSGDANGVAKGALAGGAVLVGSGPLPGSLVVLGNRSSIVGAFASWDVVVVAAPPAGCGAKEAV